MSGRQVLGDITDVRGGIANRRRRWSYRDTLHGMYETCFQILDEAEFLYEMLQSSEGEFHRATLEIDRQVEAIRRKMQILSQVENIPPGALDEDALEYFRNINLKLHAISDTVNDAVGAFIEIKEDRFN